MKNVFASLCGLLLSTCALADPITESKTQQPDTIVIVMPDKTRMTIHVNNKDELKKFSQVKIDSLFASLSMILQDNRSIIKDTTLQFSLSEKGKSGTARIKLSVDSETYNSQKAVGQALKSLEKYKMAVEAQALALAAKEKAAPAGKQKEAIKAERTEKEKQLAELQSAISEMQKELEVLRIENKVFTLKVNPGHGPGNLDAEMEKLDREMEKLDREMEKLDREIEKQDHELEKAERKEKKEAKAFYNELEVTLGFNRLVNKEPYIGPDNTIQAYPLDNGGSRYVGLAWVAGSRIGGKASPFNLQSGIEFNFNNLMFDNNLQISNVNNQVNFSTNPDYQLAKSKLAFTYVSVPLNAVLQFHNKEGKDTFRFSAGGYAGYRIGAHSKIKYTDDKGNVKKEKNRSSYQLEDYQYGVSASIGYNGFSLFSRYNLSDVFKQDRGPQANLINFGIMF